MISRSVLKSTEVVFFVYWFWAIFFVNTGEFCYLSPGLPPRPSGRLRASPRACRACRIGKGSGCRLRLQESADVMMDAHRNGRCRLRSHPAPWPRRGQQPRPSDRCRPPMTTIPEKVRADEDDRPLPSWKCTRFGPLNGVADGPASTRRRCDGARDKSGKALDQLVSPRPSQASQPAADKLPACAQSVLHDHLRADLHPVVEIDHVLVGHADAA